MKIEYMRELLLLEQFRNYTVAAEKAFLTQPSLSRHIMQMEKELGTVLIKRNTHQLEFTQDGKDACKVFQRILQIYEDYMEKLTQQRVGICGTLSLGMLYYTISQDFGNCLPAFQDQYPNVRIRQKSCQPQEIYQALIDHSLDLGVMAVNSYDNTGLIQYKEFSRQPAAAMIPKNNRLFGRTYVTLEDIRHESILLLKEDYISTTSVLDAFQRCGFTPVQICETDHIDTVPFALIETGSIHVNGSGFQIPGYDDMIQVVPIHDKTLYLSKAFAWRKDNQNPALKLFLNFVSQLYKTY